MSGCRLFPGEGLSFALRALDLLPSILNFSRKKICLYYLVRTETEEKAPISTKILNDTGIRHTREARKAEKQK